MATAQRPFHQNELASPWGDPRRCVYGFQPQPAAAGSIIVQGSSMSAQQRSLLSERLHSNLKDVVAFQAHDDASMSEDEDCFDDTDDGCTFGSPSESWSWLDSQDNTHSCVSKESDRSSHTSQPIAIPAR